MSRASPLLLLLSLACSGALDDKSGEATGAGVGVTDADNDGFFAEDGDCNDADPGIHGGAAEICDGVDNNCDGTVDEGVTAAWYADDDGDGFGDAGTAVDSCSGPEGFVTNDTDCDDGEESVYPGAYDACDGLDNNCDGDIDEDERTVFYADADGDTWGDPERPVEACLAPSGYVEDNRDCNDNTAEVWPGHPEICDELDNNCDGAVDEGVGLTWYEDRDGDEWGVADSTTLACAQPLGYAPEPGDCNDESALYHPYADESDCTDPEDYNCDGSVGYADNDLDGFAACVECNDGDPLVFPGAPEICNDIDDDCDVLTDDADPDVDLSTGSVWYADSDSDAYGDRLSTITACDAPYGYTGDQTDCDDTDAHVSPAGLEVCNEIDDDCDTFIDDDDSSVDLTTGDTFYQDADLDTFGAPGVSLAACEEPAGFVDDNTDCDDGVGAINPLATEICDGVDNDCDGATDDADGGVDLSTGSLWYRDGDGDSFGDPGATLRACVQPSGYVANASDCNDSAAAIKPTASEVCDRVDNDCDSQIDDADSSLDTSTGSPWYRDGDADTFGAGSATMACSQPTGFVSNASDCNDSSAAIKPTASEICDSLDNDCDSQIDDADSSLDASTAATWYRDADSDSYGLASSSAKACLQPSGYVSRASDCNDGVAAINPAALEICDSLDNDCDTQIDDADSSLDASTGTGWYVDSDGDGYGAGSARYACTVPSGYTSNASDCNNGDSLIHPGASERCNSLDDDCDAAADEGILGSGAACDAESCLEILSSGSSSGSGYYYVDFSGAATSAYCDMTTDGGGWTLIFFDNFESAPHPSWSTSARYNCGLWSTLLGGYGNTAGTSVSINVSTYGISHSQSWVQLYYAALDSWDGELAYVQVDGSTVWAQNQNNHSTAYMEVCGWNRGYLGSFDSEWAVSQMGAHSASSISLLAGSTLDQDPTDESFGIDNVYLWLR
jgi:hypothetical protein